MKKFCFILTGCISALACLAQPVPKWNSGVVVTNLEEVLPGDVAMHPHYDLILLRNAQGVSVFPAHKITTVRFYDCDADINRQFISKNRNVYEVVIQGKLKVIRKLKAFANERLADEARDYSYFILHENSLIPIRKFRSQVYPTMISEQPLVKMEAGGMNIKQMKSALRLIQSYNAHASQALTANY